MQRLVFKIGLLLAANAVIGGAVLGAVDACRTYEQWQTDSVLFVTPRDARFGLVLLGSSRAKCFTRLRPNLECMERELGVNVLGMATPFGGGIVPARMYLANFYERGNQADSLLFLLDPFIFFSRGPNEGHKLVYFEPVRLSFLKKMVLTGFDHRRIITYVRSKFSLKWLTQQPIEIGYYAKSLTQDDLDPERVRMRMESLYDEGLNETNFARYAGEFVRILDMAREHATRVVIAFPPTLLGDDPGMPRVLELLDECAERYDFDVRDFSDAVQDPGLYSDYDHLNSMGVEHFSSHFLKGSGLEL